jgi:hypothetical protein
MQLVAKKKLNVFGRKLNPGDLITHEEAARWDSGPHQVSFCAHLSMGWIEKVEPDIGPKRVRTKKTTLTVVPPPEDKADGFEFGCVDCPDKKYKTAKSLGAHRRKAHSS